MNEKVVNTTTSSPRRIAVLVIDRVFRSGAYADVMLDAMLDSNRLSMLDRSLATELTYGTLRWLGRLDWVFEKLYKGRIRRIPDMIRWIVDVGLYQILFLDKVPTYAAVNEAVQASKEEGGPYWSGVVNALLRSAIRNPNAILPPPFEEDPVQSISIEWSHPQWMVQRWLKQFGIKRTTELCAANNTIPKKALRVNRLKADKRLVRDALEKEGVVLSDSPWHNDFLLAEKAARLVDTQAFLQGWFTIQDESAGFVAKLLDPKPGETILDLTAAPGGKSTAMAEMAEGKAEVVAVDKNMNRVRQIRDNRLRLNIQNLHPIVADGIRPIVRPLDKILVDAPCSGLGILRKHPEIKWKRSIEDVSSLVSLQQRLLDSAAEQVKPGGVLLYSTCTVLPEENAKRVEAFLQKHPSFSIEHARAFVHPDVVTSKGWIETWPDIHGMDGSFAVRMKKAR